MDSMGVANEACVGDKLVGEGSAMRSNISEIDSRGAHRSDEEWDQAR